MWKLHHPSLLKEKISQNTRLVRLLDDQEQVRSVTIGWPYFKRRSVRDLPDVKTLASECTLCTTVYILRSLLHITTEICVSNLAIVYCSVSTGLMHITIIKPWKTLWSISMSRLFRLLIVSNGLLDHVLRINCELYCQHDSQTFAVILHRVWGCRRGL